MASFRIHRMKENPRQQFRWAPHTAGAMQIKPKDFESGETVEGVGFYDVWTQLKESPRALQVGDLLESQAGELRIYKYVGFEQAQWVIPELRNGIEDTPLAGGSTVEPAPAQR
ncbi:MAG: hypothetical protein IT161_19705 [Bryobacterales bacterium]|nr:hypothetical protein [Bryobacterales bacterium]